MRSRKSPRLEVNEQFEWPKSCHLSVCFFVVVLNLLLWSAPRIIALNRCDNGTEGGRRNIAELMLIISPVTGSHTPHFSTHKCGALIASCCSRDIYILYIVYYIEETKLVLIQYKTKSRKSNGSSICEVTIQSWLATQYLLSTSTI